MREILFRGNRLDNGEWVVGYFCEFANNRTGEQESYIQTVKQDGRIDLIHKVDPDTIGQYTGLTDKNGKRIFEGDIVKTSDITHEGVIQIPGESFEIAMRKGCWAMVAGEDWDFLETNHECIQVIGNIHDNPELLKGGEG